MFTTCTTPLWRYDAGDEEWRVVDLDGKENAKSIESFSFATLNVLFDAWRGKPYKYGTGFYLCQLLTVTGNSKKIKFRHLESSKQIPI